MLLIGKTADGESDLSRFVKTLINNCNIFMRSYDEVIDVGWSEYFVKLKILTISWFASLHSSLVNFIEYSVFD